jgi:hypothetical protein
MTRAGECPVEFRIPRPLKSRRNASRNNAATSSCGRTLPIARASRGMENTHDAKSSNLLRKLIRNEADTQRKIPGQSVAAGGWLLAVDRLDPARWLRRRAFGKKRTGRAPGDVEAVCALTSSLIRCQADTSCPNASQPSPQFSTGVLRSSLFPDQSLARTRKSAASAQRSHPRPASGISCVLQLACQADRVP